MATAHPKDNMRTDIPNFLITSIVPMRDSLRVALGLNHTSRSEREQLTYFNLFGGGLLAIFTCAIEAYMLWQNFAIAQNPEAVARSGWDWIIQHRIAYVALLLSGLALLGTALWRHVRGSVNMMVASTMIAQFIVVCMAFGIYISLQDITHDHAIYALITTLVAIACIFSIRPSLFVPGALVSLGIVMAFAHKLGALDRGDTINLSLFFVILAIASCTRYYTTIRVARSSIDLSERLREDALTGLGNIAAMRSDLAVLGTGDITVTILDINDLKPCNDRLGHSHGNTAIVLLAQALKGQFDAVGYCYRVGGDEFLVMTTALPHTDHEERVRIASALFERSCEISGIVVDGHPLTVAAGTATGTVVDVQDFDRLFKEADEAMYQQKRPEP